MYTFFVLDEYTDTLDADGVRVHCDACMDAILHPDKPRPVGDSLIGEITRQYVFVSIEGARVKGSVPAVRGSVCVRMREDE
jgi:hypothetical protein